jgi:hypothetical protein
MGPAEQINGFDIVIDKSRWGEFEETAIEDEEASDEEASQRVAQKSKKKYQLLA